MNHPSLLRSVQLPGHRHRRAGPRRNRECAADVPESHSALGLGTFRLSRHATWILSGTSRDPLAAADQTPAQPGDQEKGATAYSIGARFRLIGMFDRSFRSRRGPRCMRV